MPRKIYTPRRAGGAVVMLDDELNAMLVYARGQVRDYFGDDLWEADIDWDRGAIKDSARRSKPMRDIWKDAEVSHSIGFICGVACGLDMTPRELLDYVTDPVPARTMTGLRVLSIPLVHKRGMRDAATPKKPRKRNRHK